MINLTFVSSHDLLFLWERVFSKSKTIGVGRIKLYKIFDVLILDSIVGLYFIYSIVENLKCHQNTKESKDPSLLMKNPVLQGPKNSLTLSCNLLPNAHTDSKVILIIILQNLRNLQFKLFAKRLGLPWTIFIPMTCRDSTLIARNFYPRESIVGNRKLLIE